MDPGDDSAGQSVAKWCTRPPLQCGDLKEGRPQKVISSKTEKIRVNRHQILEKNRYINILRCIHSKAEEMIQHSQRYDPSM